jgi:hypothetical protein
MAQVINIRLVADIQCDYFGHALSGFNHIYDNLPVFICFESHDESPLMNSE